MIPGQNPHVEEQVTQQLRAAAATMQFELSCTPSTGALLTVLAASKTSGHLLELGTGAGVGTSYLAAGLGPTASLISVEVNADLQGLARQFLAGVNRLTLINGDAGEFLLSCAGRFDLIFADTWAGKFTHLDEALDLLAPGGFYIIDDLLPQATWPEGHAAKVPPLLKKLAEIDFLKRVEMDWDTGLALYVRTKV